MSGSQEFSTQQRRFRDKARNDTLCMEILRRSSNYSFAREDRIAVRVRASFVATNLFPLIAFNQWRVFYPRLLLLRALALKKIAFILHLLCSGISSQPCKERAV